LPFIFLSEKKWDSLGFVGSFAKKKDVTNYWERDVWRELRFGFMFYDFSSLTHKPDHSILLSTKKRRGFKKCPPSHCEECNDVAIYL